MWKVVLCRESDRRGDMIGEVMNHVMNKPFIHIRNIHEYMINSYLFI